MPVEARAHQVCVDIPLGALEDASPTPNLVPTDLGEHHGRADANNGSRPFRAQQWLARVVIESAAAPSDVGTIVWGYEPLDTNGCTGDFDPLTATEFRVFYAPWAYWADTNNSVVAFDCNDMPDCSFAVDGTNVVAVGGGTESPLTLSDPATNPQRLHEYVLWGTSLAEHRRDYFDDTTIYVSSDFEGDIQAGTGTSRRFGGQPTILVKGEGYRWKFTLAHEYGHVVTIFVAMPSFGPADIDCSYNGTGHQFSFPEYQSCAASEGFANFFSISVWYDADQTTGTLNYALSTGNPQVQQAGGPAQCDPQVCTAGLAIEKDWASALLKFHRDVASLETIFFDAGGGGAEGMLDAAHPWTAQTGTSAWWNDFDTTMSSYLTAAEYTSWTGFAADQEIDQ